MFARIFVSIVLVAMATAYGLIITSMCSDALSHATTVGIVFTYMPTIILLFMALVVAIAPDWNKAEW